MTRSAATLKAAAVGVAAAFGDTDRCWPPFRSGRPDGPLTAVLHALGGAAAAWTRAAASPAPRGGAGTLSGIDYLAALSDGYQRQLLRTWAWPTPAAPSASA
ncbi:MAG TPA: hypothetical protein VMU34_08690 [Mycobacterium sp.]|nr:hypothetical protein [Mycobacterium sp.]